MVPQLHGLASLVRYFEWIGNHIGPPGKPYQNALSRVKLKHDKDKRCETKL